jgi:hypothetical protein
MFATLALIKPPGTTHDVAAVIKAANALAPQWGVESIWPLLLPTACGGAMGFQGPEDFPLVDQPCPCPHPECFVVVWLTPDQLPPAFLDALDLNGFFGSGDDDADTE